MGTYFTIKELTQSSVAKLQNIDNIPSEEDKKNLNRLINDLLDPLRKDWEKYCQINQLGTPKITVNSGYRSIDLNNSMKGSATSAHTTGNAADIVPQNRKLKEFRKFIGSWIVNRNYDQLIYEKVDKEGTPQWIHVGLFNNAGIQRKEILEYNGYKYKRLN